MYFFRLGEIEEKTLLKGVTTRLAWGDRLMFSLVTLEPHAVVPEHSHDHEQMGLVLEGEFEMGIGGERRRVRRGDAYLIPSQVRHSARGFGKRAQALDVFSPPREEYKQLLG